MVYTEIKQRNGRKYYYRVISLRNGQRVGKERIYLGADLDRYKLYEKEINADNKFRNVKIEKSLKSVKDKIIKVLLKHKVKKAGIFGSYSRGEQKKNSDIDIVIEPPLGIGFGFVRIMRELESVLGKKVDLLTYKGINPLLKKKIMGDEKIILNG